MLLFCFGLGYAADFVAEEMRAHNWQVVGTKQTEQENTFIYSDNQKLTEAALEKLLQAEAVLISIPPHSQGDRVFRDYTEILQQSKNLKWLGYFSTTGVYGDTNGEWVGENSPLKPDNERSRYRMMAEQQWLSTNLPVHIFRLSGIYGPGRSALNRAKANTPTIEKQGHFFNRIHVRDISQAIATSIHHPTPDEIYNLSDDLPAGNDDVLRYAYEILGLIPPAAIPFEQAELSIMAKEFYTANKRVNADKIKQRLKIEWLYKDYKSGYKNLLQYIR